MLTATLVMSPRNPFGSRTRVCAAFSVSPASSTVVAHRSRAVMRVLCFFSAPCTQREIVRQTRQRDAPVALQRIEAERVFVGVGTVDGVVVIEAVDARARAVAGDDDGASFGA